MYMPNDFRLPTSLSQQIPPAYHQKQLSPTFGGVARPTPFARPLVGGLHGHCGAGVVSRPATPAQPQRPPTIRVPGPAASGASSLPSITTLPGFSAARMAIENRPQAPSVCSLPRPLPVSTTAAAVAAAQWLHQSQAAEAQAQVQAQARAQAQAQAQVHQAQAQAAVALNLQSQLQHFLVNEKALAASAPFMDPFGKAGPFFDLARMGHYPFGKKLFGCPQCRYMTDRKNNLKRHISTMHQECDRALECCGVLFKNKASLRDHVLIFHSNGYMCRFCGRNFCRKALLKRHLSVHSGQKDYTCSQCDYATSHKSNLERHKKVHERNGSDGSDSESTYTERSSGRSSGSGSDQEKHLNHQNSRVSVSGTTAFHDTSHDDDDLDLSDIDVDADDDALIDVDSIDIVSGLQDSVSTGSQPSSMGASNEQLMRATLLQRNLSSLTALTQTLPPTNNVALHTPAQIHTGHDSAGNSNNKPPIRPSPASILPHRWTPEI